MKLQDKETLNVALAVKDVLEGKKPAVKEEPKYPHTMYHPETGEEETANNEEEHKALSAKGYSHEKKESPEEPRAKGEKEFKAKHVVKKTGVDTKGVVTKESVEDEEEVADPLPEITPPGTGMDTELVEGISASDMKKAQAIINDPKTKGGNYSQALKDLEKWKKGSTKDPKVAAALKAAHESTEVEEETQEEESDKQKKYKAFFTKALKKFGVKSPAELEGDKKKEFFDYVDKNYESDNEEDAEEEVVETTITVSATEINKLTSMTEKKVTVDIDWIGDAKQTKDTEKKYKLKIKADERQGTADVTGDNKQILKMLTDPKVYGWDKDDVLDVWPELK